MINGFDALYQPMHGRGVVGDKLLGRRPQRPWNEADLALTSMFIVADVERPMRKNPLGRRA